jgi:glycosyltransferase involved in cell wall biosynthesis
MKRDLIVFGEDWGGLPSSTQHLMRHLSRDRRLIWVDSIGLRRPRFDRHDLKRLGNKLTAALVGVRRSHGGSVAPGFKVISPRTLPVPRGRLQRRLAAYLLDRQLKPAIAEAGLVDPILWTSLPTAVDMAGRLGESALVYYCGDDFSALAGVDHEVVAERERELSGRADLILAASTERAARFPAAKTRLLPHGVDVEHFSAAVPRARDLPDRPRIAGFYGSLSEWLDLDLLRGVIRRLPHWHFVFVGAATVDLSAIDRFSNVTLLGPRRYQQLPSYSRHWTVSLLPFRDNAQIRACNPLKLREYLAAGRPVVSTDFPALEPYRHLVETAADDDAMAAAIERAVHCPLVAQRRAAVAAETWAARAARVDELLEAL